MTWSASAIGGIGPMAAKGTGTIVNIRSVAGRIGLPAHTAPPRSSGPPATT